MEIACTPSETLSKTEKIVVRRIALKTSRASPVSPQRANFPFCRPLYLRILTNLPISRLEKYSIQLMSRTSRMPGCDSTPSSMPSRTRQNSGPSRTVIVLNPTTNTLSTVLTVARLSVVSSRNVFLSLPTSSALSRASTSLRLDLNPWPLTQRLSVVVITFRTQLAL